MKKREWMIVISLFMFLFFMVSFPIRLRGASVTLNDIIFHLWVTFFRRIRFIINAK